MLVSHQRSHRSPPAFHCLPPTSLRICGLSPAPRSTLSRESLCEPVDGARARRNSERLMKSISSRLNWLPKKLFIESTICPGIHVGRVHAVIVLWQPPTMNGSLPFVKSERRCRHVGQQRFDIPIICPQSCRQKWWVVGKTTRNQHSNTPSSVPIRLCVCCQSWRLRLSEREEGWWDRPHSAVCL